MATTEQYVFDLLDKMSPKIDNIDAHINKLDKNIAKTNQNTKSNFQGMTKSAGLVKAGIIGISAIVAGKFVQSFVKAGAQVEDLTVQFHTILGSADAAKKRIKLLTDFAAKTPFQLAGVAQSSKILETLTQGALSTGDGLRLVGDAAASSGAEFVNLSTHVGRLYSGLQANRPVGESMARLQELGIVSGKVRNKVEALQKVGKGKQAWKVMRDELEKSSGGMERMSKTVSGLTSTLKDQLNIAMVKLMSSGAWDSLSRGLTVITEKFGRLIESGNIEAFGAGLVQVSKIISNVVMGVFNSMMAGLNALVFVVSKSVQKIVEGVDIMANLLPEKLRPKWTENLSGIAFAFESFANTSEEQILKYGNNMVKNFDKTIDTVKNFKKELSAPVEKIEGGVAPVKPDDSAEPDQKAIDAAKKLAQLLQELRLEQEILKANERDAELIELRAWYQEQAAIAKEGSEARLVLDTLTEAKALEIVKFYDEEKLKWQEELAEKNAILKDQRAQEDIARTQAVASAVISSAQSVSNAVFAINKNKSDKETSMKIDAIKNSNKSEKQKQVEIEKIQKAAFEKDKKRAILQALINSALGTTMTIAQAGFPAAIPLLIAQGIANAAAIAVIAAQKFQTGGVVQKQPGVPSTGDQTLIRANPGERVLTKEQNQQLGTPINIGDTYISIGGNADQNTVNQIKEVLSENTDNLLDELKVMQDRGQLSGLVF